MAEGLGGGEAAVGRAQHALDQLLAGLVDGHFSAEQAGDVDVDVLAHGPHGSRIGGDLDHRQDGIADHVALSGRGRSGRRSRRPPSK